MVEEYMFNDEGHIGTFGHVSAYFGTFWNIWARLGTFWNIWEHLGMFGHVWVWFGQLSTEGLRRDYEGTRGDPLGDSPLQNLTGETINLVMLAQFKSYLIRIEVPFCSTLKLVSV